MMLSKVVPTAIRAFAAGLLILFTYEILDPQWYWLDMRSMPANAAGIAVIERLLSRVFFAIGVYLLATPVGEMLEFASSRRDGRSNRSVTPNQTPRTALGREVKSQSARNQTVIKTSSVFDGYDNLDDGQS